MPGLNPAREVSALTSAPGAGKFSRVDCPRFLALSHPVKNTHTLSGGSPENLPAGTPAIEPMRFHIPEDWSPVSALCAIADESSAFGKRCEGVCPAQQEARFRELSIRLILETGRINELMRRQADAIATAQAALARVALGLAPERHARDDGERLTPGQYYALEARLAAASEARHDAAAAIAQRRAGLEALDLLAFTLRQDCFPVL